jgi:hypothetical protein
VLSDVRITYLAVRSTYLAVRSTYLAVRSTYLAVRSTRRSSIAPLVVTAFATRVFHFPQTPLHNEFTHDTDRDLFRVVGSDVETNGRMHPL